MDEELIRQIVEQIDPDKKISEEKINDLIETLNQEKDINSISSSNNVDYLKEELNKETDWRKKASIAAKIISLGLD